MKKQLFQLLWKSGGMLILAAILALAAPHPGGANNIAVTNVSLVNTDTDTGTTDVRFDLRWENSWRASWTETDTGYGDITVTNWDAAWVFVKFRDMDGEWHPAWLTANGHTAPAGATIDVGTNGGGTNVGAFIYRSAAGAGNLNLSGVRLRWNYATNGVARTNQIDVSVHAIEMVYIPQGPFYAGDGATANICGEFEDGTSGAPFLVTSEGEIILGGTNTGSLGNHTNAGLGGTSTDYFNATTIKTLPAAYPKGYNAFYCMKYEITQGQYTEFLNLLTATQAGACFSASYTGTNRCTVGGSWPNYTNGAPDRAANYVNGGAYADWAGLRPMTELEYEKACRGPKYPVANEFAWGNTSSTVQTNHFGGDGSGTETAMPTNANYNYASETKIGGPVRAGIYATASSTRAQAGAGYYGVMQLTGNLCERAVTVGRPAGWNFVGEHGDGNINTSPGWSSTGGLRGAGYSTSGAGYIRRVSNRTNINWEPGAGSTYGWRGVRAAP